MSLQPTSQIPLTQSQADFYSDFNQFILDLTNEPSTNWGIYEYSATAYVFYPDETIKITFNRNRKPNGIPVNEIITRLKEFKLVFGTEFEDIYNIKWGDGTKSNTVVVLKMKTPKTVIKSTAPSLPIPPLPSSSSSTGLSNPMAQLTLSQVAQAGPSSSQTPPQSQGLSLLSNVSMSSQDIRRALGKIQTGLDTDISETEFRNILRKNPNLLRLAKRSAEEGLVGNRSVSQLRTAMQEITTLNDIQHSSFFTIEGEVMLRIKQPRPVPLQFQIVSGNRSRKPVGL
jgi:hypothetical protein